MTTIIPSSRMSSSLFCVVYLFPLLGLCLLRFQEIFGHGIEALGLCCAVLRIPEHTTQCTITTVQCFPSYPCVGP